jgi:hypothetical protein
LGERIAIIDRERIIRYLLSLGMPEDLISDSVIDAFVRSQQRIQSVEKPSVRATITEVEWNPPSKSEDEDIDERLGKLRYEVANRLDSQDRRLTSIEQKVASLDTLVRQGRTHVLERCDKERALQLLIAGLHEVHFPKSKAYMIKSDEDDFRVWIVVGDKEDYVDCLRKIGEVVSKLELTFDLLLNVILFQESEMEEVDPVLIEKEAAI